VLTASEDIRGRAGATAALGAHREAALRPHHAVRSLGSALPVRARARHGSYPG
jgi:hypothetical protein